MPVLQSPHLHKDPLILSPSDCFPTPQVSAVMPVLRALTSSKTLFYCHFPDMLLSQGREVSLLKVCAWSADV